ncbi:NAD-P-binding protein [Rickenella mellea]|uniref:NAD-P-binding protein n=1 Tax=Rickenella mellea TaxID=50990 RepID=A0A4Y7PV30_9AGAM|nr:NAD-P-binding protein [Rickenella mellea]
MSLSSNDQNLKKKLILVIGATGAQGLAVIDALLKPSADGSPSPYAVRALTRDVNGKRAKELAGKGVECVEGSFMDFPKVAEALKGVYGTWVNTDGFTVGEAKELYAGMRIFELAKQTGTVKHYVWSNLDYVAKKSGYNPAYRAEHYDAKGRVGEWLKVQPSVPTSEGMTWSAVTTGPYMDMLEIGIFGPLNRRADGTWVFASPIQNGHVPMIALTDLGFFARYSFDNPELVSGKDLEVASDIVGWDYLVETFQRVTGQKAVVVHESIDEWMDNFAKTDRPVANERPVGDGSTTWKENFTAFWKLWQDDVLKRDMDWIRSVNPGGHTLESWMRTTGYTGQLKTGLLKNAEDGKAISSNPDKIKSL